MTQIFLEKLSYKHGYRVSISRLWKTFIGLIEIADSNFAIEIARGYEPAFRWYLAGYIHLIESEYESQPSAIVMVEIYQGKKGHRCVAVQRDGNRRELLPDEPPEPPMMLRAGTRVNELIALKDLKQIGQIGFKRFLAEIKAGKRRLSPRSMRLLHEDSLMNVAPHSSPVLAETLQRFKSHFRLVNEWRARKGPVT